MKASTTRLSSLWLHRLHAAGTKRTAGQGRVTWRAEEHAETLAGVGEFAVIDRLVAGRDQPPTRRRGPR